MKRVWINRNVLDRIKLEAAVKSPLETGGVLAGFISVDDNDVVITEMIGPGPKAKHRKWSFTPDYTYHREEIGKIFDKSDGLITYLGDWHTHPNALACMSCRDRIALRNIAEFPFNYVDRPIMLVLGGNDATGDEWVPRAWRIQRVANKLFWKRWDYILQEVVEFD